MTVVWTRPARDDLARIEAFVIERDANAAERASREAIDAGRLIGANPRIGPMIDVRQRKWPVGASPYLLIDRITADTVENLRVRHGREDWRPLS